MSAIVLTKFEVSNVIVIKEEEVNLTPQVFKTLRPVYTYSITLDRKF